MAATNPTFVKSGGKSGDPLYFLGVKVGRTPYCTKCDGYGSTEGFEFDEAAGYHRYYTSCTCAACGGCGYQRISHIDGRELRRALRGTRFALHRRAIGAFFALAVKLDPVITDFHRRTGYRFYNHVVYSAVGTTVRTAWCWLTRPDLEIRYLWSRSVGCMIGEYRWYSEWRTREAAAMRVGNTEHAAYCRRVIEQNQAEARKDWRRSPAASLIARLEPKLRRGLPTPA